MGKPPMICPVLETKRDKTWPYEEYYIGERDKEHRRSGAGENHWTGAESLEWYTGHFVRDAMNGCGEYRWRYYGREGVFVTYEGWFYANSIHGYGTMSYPDGRVFTGLYHKNMRWGPGIESHTNLREDVGFWRGTQLVRLAWRPDHPSVTLDFITEGNGKAHVEPYRVLLARNTRSIGATNSAIELLKQNGADPILAADIWPKLYLKHSTDLESKACYIDAFDFDYYRGEIHSLEEVTNVNQEHLDSESQESRDDYFAWNNGNMMLQMMKHCYKHDTQRKNTKIDLEKILNGPRNYFKSPGKHEQDCRTLLMCSYLGRIANVARLINEHYVHPDIADIQGNTALMYAAAGDKSGVVHFLVEAGANVNCYNDSCCTALGIALMRFVCVQRDVPPNEMVQAFLPPRSGGSPAHKKISEWYINRELSQDLTNKLFKSVSKTTRISSVRKSLMIVRETTPGKSKSDTTPPRKSTGPQDDSEDEPPEDNHLHSTVDNEYCATVNNLFIGPNLNVPYIFDVHNMVTDIDTAEEVPKQITEKVNKGTEKINRKASKVFKNIKTSKDNLWHGNPDEISSLSSAEKLKLEILSKVMLTILQLFADGATPRLVRCPQPALFMAVASGSPELVRYLVRYGADVNETYPDTFDYKAIDVAISYPFTSNNVLVIRELLENGARANVRLQFPDEPGPTLLHAVLSRKTESAFEDHICGQILELLLKYNCNPASQFKGRSAMDVAMTRNMEFFDIFIKSPKTNLNEVVNSLNQSVLVKMFSLAFSKHISGIDRLPILTNLLLYGADPLIECQDGEDKFRNIFAYAKKTLAGMEAGTPSGPQTGKDLKSQKSLKSEVKIITDQKGKSVKGKTPSSKSVGRLVAAADEINDYKQAIDLMTECARILHIRWLQAKLMKELVAVIYKYDYNKNRYKHRPWNMILKEHKTQKNVALWLTPQRCFEISDIMKAAKKKPYQDVRLLRHLLCIVQFYHKRSKVNQSLIADMTFHEKCMVESDVESLIKEHKIGSKLAEEAEAWKGLYVKPELAVRADEKFRVCFECALPVEDNTKIPCSLCGLISFCSTLCLKNNIDRASCHPCSDYLREELFPDSKESVL